ncbi:hypothetical protein GCM10023213_39080 [Prosthecobacter algae]|uniref:Uncharacterized protein n=1 Tax=Prosthecobacter algae TaxID=1144682 RepID=A0ABP9PKB5_9BACT
MSPVGKISAAFAQEIQQALMAGTLRSPEPELHSAFGSVYFGPLAPFAQGLPHYGMVRAPKEGGKHLGVMRFSPVTSKTPSARWERETSLAMPKGTPLSRDRNSESLQKDSWLLLGLGPIPVPRQTLKSQITRHESHYVGLLPEEWIQKARERLNPKPTP